MNINEIKNINTWTKADMSRLPQQYRFYFIVTKKEDEFNGEPIVSVAEFRYAVANEKLDSISWAEKASWFDGVDVPIRRPFPTFGKRRRGSSKSTTRIFRHSRRLWDAGIS